MMIFFSKLFKNKTVFKSNRKEVVDNTLGKIFLEYKDEFEEFYFWEVELNSINKDKTETSITLDGDFSNPSSKCIDRLKLFLNDINSFMTKIQQELNDKHPEKNIDIKRYNLEDISVYHNENSDIEESDLELEFYSESSKDIISVEFSKNKLILLEFY